jgi:hypothetical protein
MLNRKCPLLNMTDLQANGAVNALKALIANPLAAKGLSRLRAGLRAQIKGLTIIIDLIRNLLVSPHGHLFNILVL